MSCDVGKVAEGLENELWHRWSDVRVGEWGGALSPTLLPLYLYHSSFYNRSATSPTSQALHILHLASCPCFGWWKISLWWTSWLQQVTKFRSRYSFGWLLRVLLRAVNLFSSSHIVSRDSSFNIHNALYFVKYPSRAAQYSPAGRGLKTPGLGATSILLHNNVVQKYCPSRGRLTLNILSFIVILEFVNACLHKTQSVSSEVRNRLILSWTRTWAG